MNKIYIIIICLFCFSGCILKKEVKNNDNLYGKPYINDIELPPIPELLEGRDYVEQSFMEQDFDGSKFIEQSFMNDGSLEISSLKITKISGESNAKAFPYLSDYLKKEQEENK